MTVTGSADIYDPKTNTLSPLTASLSVPRAYHTATQLTDGTVLIAGGGNSSDPSVGEFQALSSVEIYDPILQTFSFAASLNFGRGYQTATLINAGAVLTEGGFNGTNTDYTILASAELYNSSAATGPVASLSPAALTFASQSVGTTSGAQTITLSNTGTAALTITSVSVTGTNAGDFAETNTCPASLAASANCTISVTFKPTATGARSASVKRGGQCSREPAERDADRHGSRGEHADRHAQPHFAHVRFAKHRDIQRAAIRDAYEYRFRRAHDYRRYHYRYECGRLLGDEYVPGEPRPRWRLTRTAQSA